MASWLPEQKITSKSPTYKKNIQHMYTYVGYRRAIIATRLKSRMRIAIYKDGQPAIKFLKLGNEVSADGERIEG